MTECESPLGVPEKQGAFAEDGIGYITHIPHALHNPRSEKGRDMQQKRETIFVKKNKNRS